MTSGGAFRDALALASSDGEGGSDKINVRRSDPLRPIHRLLRLVLPAPADTNGPEHDTRAESMTHALKWDWQDEDTLPGILFVCGALLIGSLVGPTPTRAQTPDDAGGLSLIERYQRARHRALARRHLRQEGHLPVHHPPAQLPTSSIQADSAEPEPSFPLHDVRPVWRLERDWFQEKFADTEWAFLGKASHHAFLDTARTLDLWTRLQTAFGDPTRTPADAPLETPPDNQTRFEYWFVVNDSIPVQVTDVRGPRDRGLVVAVERSYRSQLRALRDTLLAPLRTQNGRRTSTTTTTSSASAGTAPGSTDNRFFSNRSPEPTLSRDSGRFSTRPRPPNPPSRPTGTLHERLVGTAAID